MSRTLLIVTVALAAFALLNIVFSFAVAVAWRSGLAIRLSRSSAGRASALVQFRSLPSLTAALVTAAAVVPAFAIFEPQRASETAGPLVLLLASIAVVQLAAAGATALVAAGRTSTATRRWLRVGTLLDLDPPAGVPAYAVDTQAPIVALVGVFHPKLIAARSVIAACTAAELTAIVAHERGHLRARDNLKRWLMASAPDALRWTPLHHEIVAAWDAAAEDAADDAATVGDLASRVDLAALLVKIARLAPLPAWPAATVSPFVQPAGLDRRVRRLLADEGRDENGSIARRHRGVAATLFALMAAVVSQPAVLLRLYDAIEAVIAFGR